MEVEVTKNAFSKINGILNYLIYPISAKNVADIREIRGNTITNLTPEILALLQQPFDPWVTTNVVIYYPISRFGEFEASSVSYSLPPGITPFHILGSVSSFYNTKLKQDNIMAYYNTNPSAYTNLLTQKMGDVKLADVIGDNMYIDSITALNGFQYLVNLKTINF